jgi:hypothetical protein
MATVIPDISPIDLLGRVRGMVEDARPAYPETIHLEIRDTSGGRWRFGTKDAHYAPEDPDLLRGKTVVDVDLEGPLGNLTFGFSDGTSFRVWMDPPDTTNDPGNWMLLTPDELFLLWGPVGKWSLTRGSDPI